MKNRAEFHLQRLGDSLSLRTRNVAGRDQRPAPDLGLVGQKE
jgi:hypothetical protein